MKIRFDLDSIFCTEKLWEKAKVYDCVYDCLKEVEEEGDEIIIHTGRKMNPHNGNIRLVNKSIGFLTFKQLKGRIMFTMKSILEKSETAIYINNKSFNFKNRFQLKTF